MAKILSFAVTILKFCLLVVYNKNKYPEGLKPPEVSLFCTIIIYSIAYSSIWNFHPPPP